MCECEKGEKGREKRLRKSGGIRDLKEKEEEGEERE